MPTRLCSHPRCPDPATYRGRCADHARRNNAETHRNRHVYNSKRWRVLRRHVITAQPICATPGCEALSTDADHIVAIEAGGAPFDPANVQGLCAPCHGRKTKMEMAA